MGLPTAEVLPIKAIVSGRTERVNARDLIHRAEVILFEGAAIREWLAQLIKRANATIEAGRNNKVIEVECSGESDELLSVLDAFNEAHERLRVLSNAIDTREGK